ncbi:MAG TPA: hypothetical protein VEL31_02055 [Ktedonobacteraceae bacterium]|nr:hypothetical protein [Ktedonobacteraceae bacterium]
MAKLTRRKFFRDTSVSAATLGALAVVPALSTVAESSPETVAPELSTAAAVFEPLMAHVRDIATGEVSLLVGSREIIYRDPEFVMRLLKLAR